MLVSQSFNTSDSEYRTLERTHGVLIIELTSDGEFLTSYRLKEDSANEEDIDEVDFLQNYAGKILQVNAKFCDSSKQEETETEPLVFSASIDTEECKVVPQVVKFEKCMPGI